MITYETVIGAVNGDTLAMLEVLEFFDGFIDRLCVGPFVDRSGRVRYGVDTQMKTEMQGKLMQAILRFKI